MKTHYWKDHYGSIIKECCQEELKGDCPYTLLYKICLDDGEIEESKVVCLSTPCGYLLEQKIDKLVAALANASAPQVVLK